MASLNTTNNTKLKSTAKRVAVQSEYKLRRLLMTCFLWEDTFYNSGSSIAEDLKIMVNNTKTDELHAAVIEAREDMHIRHAPLYLITEMVKVDKHRKNLSSLIERVIQRPDDATELVAIYWKDGKKALPKQFKKGIGLALRKFNEYSLSKYQNKGAVKLVDLFNLCHPKPANKEQEKLWKKFMKNKLESADTWEVRLSGGEDKKTVFTDLIKEDKLGGLAMLRNLRNMQDAGVTDTNIRKGIAQANYSRVLPFRFIAAAKYAPRFEPELETVMLKSTAELPKLKGKTLILVDVSLSMKEPVSSKSDMNRIDAGSALAILLREICEDVEVYSFDTEVRAVPSRRGFALRDAIGKADGGGTKLGKAVSVMNTRKAERLIVFTDEESQDPVPDPAFDKAYMVNVASSKNTVTNSKWVSVTGFSEKIVDFIHMVESF